MNTGTQTDTQMNTGTQTDTQTEHNVCLARHGSTICVR